MYKVVLRWIEGIGPESNWNEENDDYYIDAEGESKAIYKAVEILQYQCSGYGEGSEVRVHYASAEPTDEPYECDFEKYFGDNGHAVGKRYPIYVDTYSMRIIQADSYEYLPYPIRKFYEEARQYFEKESNEKE